MSLIVECISGEWSAHIGLAIFWHAAVASLPSDGQLQTEIALHICNGLGMARVTIAAHDSHAASTVAQQSIGPFWNGYTLMRPSNQDENRRERTAAVLRLLLLSTIDIRVQQQRPASATFSMPMAHLLSHSNHCCWNVGDALDAICQQSAALIQNHYRLDPLAS